MPNDGLQLAFHHRYHARPWYKKVLKVRSGKNQHFPRSVDAIKVIPVSWLCHFGPALEVAQFLLRFLGKEVVSKPKRQLSVAVQFVHNAIIIGIVLKTAAGINDTGDSKTV